MEKRPVEKRIWVCLIGILILFLAGCSQIGRNPTDNSTAWPNNASSNLSDKLYPQVRGFDIKYCEEMGYSYEYRPDEKGIYRGYCRLTSEIECPSEDFADGLCHREHSLCEVKGHVLKIAVEVHGNTTITYPICIFPDNSYCREIDFFNRKCYVKW